jgi:hypothetical protein
MSIKIYFPGIVISCCVFSLFNCGEKKESVQQTAFTKSDSLTETYLALQDSILMVWNIMVVDDNQKVKAMHTLVHELMISGKTDIDELVAIEQRLEQLNSLRYTQETMANADVVEEYDFATTSLISEMISIAESRVEYTSNTNLQKLANNIKIADDRVNIYREEYDDIIVKYNNFLEENQKYLKEIDTHHTPEKKPVFEMNAEE